jgi:hypothetical protein
MPGLNIPTLVKVGCLEQDTLGVLNTAFNNTTSVVANGNLTGVGFAVFNTGAAVSLLPAGAPAGTYRISFYVVITTLFVTNTAIVMTVGWTDDGAAQTLAVTGGALTVGTTLIGSQLIRSTGSAAITWTPTKTGSAASAGAAAISVTLERIL